MTQWDINHLFRTYHARLRHFVQKRKLAWYTADDIVQDTFLRVVATPSLPDVKYAQSYLYRTAQNLVVDHFRRERILKFVPDAEKSLEYVASDSPLPDQIVWSRQELRQLQAAINKLPAPTREVFVLARLEGKTYAEIGEKLGIPPQTAFSRMVRALTLLRDQTKIDEKN
ncbi:RNA polymerase sigma factor [Thalassospira sp. TSL5-1]|uniref:RNA polymerase sigma factor n=1 Tax=Thalassospira sp. TSL5-1 TaxID=1544451 RepID=UPI0009400E13|nr:sigma-70 family RNA polymerase sigma factor [Thalassospira sp. TSL5-1]OKH87287.1 fec I [Thalassospira sp. TSL5-1]